MASKTVLKANTNSELLSYIINSNPTLSDEIDLPVQGQSIIEIGKLISSNERYKNAFINTVNLIGLTVAKRNRWENPWYNMTYKGELRHGQQVRELICDLVEAHNYNDLAEDTTYFLNNFVPNVFNYIHEVNYQKFYVTTTSDEQLAMAFETEGGLLDFIENIISMNWESYVYDCYIVDKYMLCRRILDGTMSPQYIENFDILTAREKVSAIKDISNKFTFRSPNYNPAGIRKSTSFDDQILIVSTDFEAKFSTEVLATSFFRDEADMKARLVLCDGFGNHDTTRLSDILGDQYTPLSKGEIDTLAKIPAVLISRGYFMDYNYSLGVDGPVKELNFYNPTTLKNNHYLHVWRVFSTSPFENACVFTPNEIKVLSILVTPPTATVTPGQSMQLSASVGTEGFANKAVKWSTTVGTITSNGKLTIPSDTKETTATVTATSIYNTEVAGTATITIA